MNNPRLIDGGSLPGPYYGGPVDSAAETRYSGFDVLQQSPRLRTLWDRKGTLFLFALTGGLLAWMAVWHQPYQYESRAFVEVQGINEDLLNKRELDPTAKNDNASQSAVSTEARILQSGVLYDRAAARLNRGTGTEPPLKPAVTRSEISRDIRVRTHEGDRILEIVSDSTDPKRSAAIANALAAEFVQQDLDSRWAASQSTSQWLARELDDLSRKLASSETDLQRFAERSGLVLNGDQGEVGDNALQRVQDELVRAEADRISKQSLYDAYTNSAAGSLAALPPDHTTEEYVVELSNLNKQLAELEATYTPTYYKVPPLKAQIAAIQKELAQSRDLAARRMENDLKTAQKREAMLQSRYTDQLREATGDSAKMVQYAALRNQVETNRAIYSQMLQKVKGYSVTAAMQAGNLRIVDPAEVPLFPSRPNKPMITILSAFGFLCIGGFWVMAQAARNRHIMEPGEAQLYLQTPELGVIPAAGNAKPTALRRSNGDRHNRALPGAPHERHLLETVTWHSSPSIVAESFRSTSASLLLPNHGGHRPRVLVVSSVSPAEGKTTVASNIAITLAGAVGRVLLIDGDRRRARLHAIFGCENKQGLAELLDQAGEGELQTDGFIVPTNVPNLFLLPKGTASQDTSDHLYSARMAALIDLFRNQYDAVVIDTPPLLHLPDARIIGRLSDGIVLVMRAGRVKTESAAATAQRLREDGIPILGTVLNDWNPHKNGYGVYPKDKHVYSYFAE